MSDEQKRFAIQFAIGFFGWALFTSIYWWLIWCEFGIRRPEHIAILSFIPPLLFLIGVVFCFPVIILVIYVFVKNVQWYLFGVPTGAFIAYFLNVVINYFIHYSGSPLVHLLTTIPFYFAPFPDC